MKLPLKKVCLLIVVALLSYGAWIEIRRGGRYKLGMSITEVRSLEGEKYPVKQTGYYYSKEPTQHQLLNDEVSYIYDDDSGILLFFNHYGVLIEKRRVKLLGVNWPRVADFILDRVSPH